MMVEVTDKVSGKKLSVNPENVLLLEPIEGGSHLVLEPSMGRAVVEDYELLKPFFGVVSADGAGLKALAKLKK